MNRLGQASGPMLGAIRGALSGAGLALALSACSTLPSQSHSTYAFPKDATVVTPKRLFTRLGMVKAKANYPTLEEDEENAQKNCRNYYNKAVSDLVKLAKKQGADAVIEVRSVVFLIDGKTEMFDRPECIDDGADAQVLVAGVAVKWEKPKKGALPAPEALGRPKPSNRAQGLKGL